MTDNTAPKPNLSALPAACLLVTTQTICKDCKRRKYGQNATAKRIIRESNNRLVPSTLGLKRRQGTSSAVHNVSYHHSPLTLDTNDYWDTSNIPAVSHPSAAQVFIDSLNFCVPYSVLSSMLDQPHRLSGYGSPYPSTSSPRPSETYSDPFREPQPVPSTSQTRGAYAPVAPIEMHDYEDRNPASYAPMEDNYTPSPLWNEKPRGGRSKWLMWGGAPFIHFRFVPKFAISSLHAFLVPSAHTYSPLASYQLLLAVPSLL